MFNQTLNLKSSHVMYGRVTPPLQRVRPYCLFKGSGLLNQEASNASVFLPFHYWKPCPKEHYYQTAILNFYRYLSCISRKCHTIIANGIRAVIINNQYATKLFNDYEYDFWLSLQSEKMRTI